MQRGRRREAPLHVESVLNPPRAGTSASPHFSLTLPVLCASVSWTRTKRVRRPDGRYVHSGWKMFPLSSIWSGSFWGVLGIGLLKVKCWRFWYWGPMGPDVLYM